MAGGGRQKHVNIVLGVGGIQKSQNLITLVLGRSHNNSHAFNLVKKCFYIFFHFGPIRGGTRKN